MQKSLIRMSSGDTESQPEALLDCKRWTIEIASLRALGVDLTMKMTGVTMKFGREAEVSNLSRGVANPRPSAAGYQKARQSVEYDRRTKL
jgi:hypothetical protein